MKHQQIRLEDEEFEDFKAKADRLGLSLQSAGKLAIMNWARPKGDAGPFGELTQTEEACIHYILEMLRDDSIPSNKASTMKPSLYLMAEEWLKRHPG
jgi:hypothetical protein